MKKYNWTIEEEKWLIENYCLLGPDKCANHLGLKKDQITRKTHKLKLKLPLVFKNKLSSKPNNKCNVNPDLFYTVNKKEIAYLLGIFWSDGFLNRSKNGRNHNFGFTMVNDDVEQLKPTLSIIGKWHYFNRKKIKEEWKDSTNVVTNNKRIYDFLIENDFDKKSYISADKILNKIPKRIIHYFFRGLVDGDGCFYYKQQKNTSLKQMSISSTYEQDWTYVENILLSLNVKYKINRFKREKSSYSIIRITNKNGIKLFGEFLYENYENDNIGLKRKYAVYKKIIN